MRLIIVGAPGAGKGTQADILGERLGIRHLSTGAILRREIQRGSELGMLAKRLIDDGEFVPDDVISQVVETEIRDLGGYILDGYPRTVVQADRLISFLGDRGQWVDAVIALEVSLDALMSRIAGRAAGGDRPDDSPDVVGTRMRIYQERTAPVLEYLEGRLPILHIDGSGSVSDVAGDINTALSEVRPSRGHS